MTTTNTNKIECDVCHKQIANGYLSRHSKFCGVEKKSSYNKERAQEYYKKNRERILDKYQNNKDKSKAYYQSNADKIKERQKVYNETNKERLREKVQCEHCRQSVNRYYLNRHVNNCYKNPAKIDHVMHSNEAHNDFTFDR